MTPDTLPPSAGGPDAASADRRSGGARPDTISPSTSIDGVLIDQIADWLMSSALGRTGVDTIFEGCCQRLHAAGVPLVRARDATRSARIGCAASARRWRCSRRAERLGDARGGRRGPV